MLPSGAPVANSFQLNNAANWYTAAFIPSVGGTLSALRIFFSAKAGAPAAADITCEIQADSGGNPAGTGTVTNGGPVNLSATPAGNAWNSWSFATGPTLSAFTRYHAFVKNGNATPGTNNVTLRWLNLALGNPYAINNLTNPTQVAFNWAPYTSTNSGGAWQPNVSGLDPLRLDWSGGTYEGFPVSNVTQVSTTVVQAGTEVGVKFTLPGPSSLLHNIVGVSLTPAKSISTPTGVPVYNLYVGNSTTTPTATTNQGTSGITINVGANFMPLLFSSPVQVQGGSVVRFTLANTFADTGSAGYQLGYGLVLDTDTNSLPLAPYEGTWKMTTLSGGAWTDDATGMLPYGGLFLDSTGEFSVSGGGGGGVLYNPSLTGGMAG